MTTYGYCRISRKQQNIDRQVRNIKGAYPEAVILQEAYTGTKVEGRKEFEKLLKAVKPGDTIVFDSVSRMSRNAADGFALYQDLLEKDVELVFLKEPHINTSTYREAAEKQIQLAFDQAQKEVDDLHQRTREGIATAKLSGKQIGGVTGKKLNIKKREPAKQMILKYSRDFNGTLNDAECMKLIGIARNTYYHYKAELRGG